LGILFIIIRKIPVLSRLPEESFIESLSLRATFVRFKRVKNEFILSHFFQSIIIGNLEKSLRRLKILILKMDNILDRFLRKFKKNTPS